MNKHSDIDVNMCLCVTLGANEDVGGCWGGGGRCSGWHYDAMFWQQCYETA